MLFKAHKIHFFFVLLTPDLVYTLIYIRGQQVKKEPFLCAPKHIFYKKFIGKIKI